MMTNANSDSVIQTNYKEKRKDAAERIRRSNFSGSYKAAMSKAPVADKWRHVEAGGRRLLNRFGAEVFASIPEGDLCLAFLAFGNVKTRLDHARTMRNLMLPRELRKEPNHA